jgi:hypothetical protein
VRLHPAIPELELSVLAHVQRPRPHPRRTECRPQAESLATHFTTATQQAPAFFFYGKLDRSGQPQPPFGATHAVFPVPWYVAGRRMRAILPGIPESQQDAALDTVLAASATLSARAANQPHAQEIQI